MVAKPVGYMHHATSSACIGFMAVQVAAREAQWTQLTHELAACFAENDAAMQDTEEESAAVQRCQHLQDVLKERQGVQSLGLVSFVALIADRVGDCCLDMFQHRDSAESELAGWRGQAEMPLVLERTNERNRQAGGCQVFKAEPEVLILRSRLGPGSRRCYGLDVQSAPCCWVPGARLRHVEVQLSPCSAGL